MSDYRAIAAVTKTLQNMLQPAVTAAVPGAVVKPARPDRNPSLTSSAEVAIYLYQVSANPASRNEELPVRRSDGTLIRPPQVALDLHYLVSFYGDDSKLVPQILLGAVVSTLHSFPRPRVEDMPGGASGTDGQELSGTGLQQQADRLRFIPLALTHEELSKLWSIFFQVPYTLSLGYLGSVVLIEPDLVPQPMLPIRRPGLLVMPAQPPRIESISPQVVPADPAATIRLRGRHLSGVAARVRIGGLSASLRSASGDSLEVPLPAGLRPGVQMAQVVTEEGLESNRAAFVLEPTILDVSCSPLTRKGSPPVVSVRLRPEPGPVQQILLLLNELQESSAAPRSYAYGPVPAGRGGGTVTIEAAGLKPGTYLVRVQVDGVASPLTVDEDPGSPTFEMYVGPRLEIA